MRESFDWVRHTNEVLRQLSVAERRLLEAESAERGYLLTGERSYLESGLVSHRCHHLALDPWSDLCGCISNLFRSST